MDWRGVIIKVVKSVASAGRCQRQRRIQYQPGAAPQVTECDTPPRAESPHYQPNNLVVVENAIRPTALGKKNWLFIGNAAAGQRSAIIYTVIENCRRRSIEPCYGLTRG